LHVLFFQNFKRHSSRARPQRGRSSNTQCPNSCDPGTVSKLITRLATVFSQRSQRRHSQALRFSSQCLLLRQRFHRSRPSNMRLSWVAPLVASRRRRRLRSRSSLGKTTRGRASTAKLLSATCASAGTTTAARAELPCARRARQQ